MNDASRWVPAARNRTLGALHDAAKHCEGCDLYREATQAVMGSGSTSATYLLVGEQPGDKEDLEGAPFVGPAGRVLDDALERAGLDRRDVFLTNAVKHFRFRQRGKRRIHQSPSRTQILACRPWLTAEIGLVEPAVVVLLGASAGQALLGSSFRVGDSRGRPLDWPSGELPVDGTPPTLMATIHPSAVLRGRDRREELLEGLVDDLRRAAEHATGQVSAHPPDGERR